MSSPARQRRGNERAMVPKDTLHMLSVLLKAAFRMHCTGESVAGKTAWQLVHDVQGKLADLSQCPGTVVSEERLAEYIEQELRGCEKMGAGSGHPRKNAGDCNPGPVPVPIFSQPLTAPAPKLAHVA
jgi:hypothetical protein